MATHTLAVQFKAARVPAPVTEYRFHPTRRWRFDFAWPERAVALEVDGGGFVAGRHSRGLGMERDNEKLNEAAVLGWVVLRVTPRQVENGMALDWLRALLKATR